MLKLTLLVLVFSLSLGKPATGQTTAADDTRAVIDAVQVQLQWLGNRNVDALATTFTDHAVIVVSRQLENGATNSVTPVAEWLERSRANQDGTPFEERISNIQVTIDSGQLAHLRADFAIIVNGVTTSSGKDHFMLIKEPDGWKVALLGYTNVPSSR